MPLWPTPNTPGDTPEKVKMRQGFSRLENLVNGAYDWALQHDNKEFAIKELELAREYLDHVLELLYKDKQ